TNNTLSLDSFLAKCASGEVQGPTSKVQGSPQKNGSPEEFSHGLWFYFGLWTLDLGLRVARAPRNPFRVPRSSRTGRRRRRRATEGPCRRDARSRPRGEPPGPSSRLARPARRRPSPSR